MKFLGQDFQKLEHEPNILPDSHYHTGETQFLNTLLPVVEVCW